MNRFDGDEFTRNGFCFRVRVERDDDLAPPWVEHDGHGHVSDWTNRPKRAGELVLCIDRGSFRYYAFDEAVRTARADGWGHGEDVPGETRGQKAARAARADFEHLRGWCRGDWCWIVVTVELLEGEDVTSSDTVGGFESTDQEGVTQAVNEMADTLGAALAAEMAAGLYAVRPEPPTYTAPLRPGHTVYGFDCNVLDLRTNKRGRIYVTANTKSSAASLARELGYTVCDMSFL